MTLPDIIVSDSLQMNKYHQIFAGCHPSEGSVLSPMLHAATIALSGAGIIRIIKVHSSMPMPYFENHDDRETMLGRFGDFVEVLDGFINFSVLIDSPNGMLLIDKGENFIGGRVSSYTMFHVAFDIDSKLIPMIRRNKF